MSDSPSNSRFVADADDIEMMGAVDETEDLATPAQKRANKRHAAAMDDAKHDDDAADDALADSIDLEPDDG
jgi:hypothetical protein